MQQLIPLLVMASGLLLSMAAHRAVDEARLAEGEGTERVYLPSGSALRVASMGYHTVVADVLWVRAVLSFADIYAEIEPQDARWLEAMLDSVAMLDPGWRTVYYHGGGMLRVIGDIDASDALFERGAAALPGEPYFVFSLAMNAYLYHHDNEAAARYLDRAAAIPGAPVWYRSASAGFMSDSGQRQAAIRYLKEQHDEATDPSVRDSLREKLQSLIHDEYSEQLTAQWVALGSPGSLDGLSGLPEDPYGVGWVVAAEGDVVSARVSDDRKLRAERDGRRMLTDRSLWAAP
jgi:hypothetical protein